jgi:hypothetical protein
MPSGAPDRQSSLQVDGVSIGGQSVGFSDKGLVVAGTATPLPATSPLAEVLKSANISVQYLQAIDDPDGVVSPGLVIVQHQQVPNGPNLTLSYVFGRAVAHATAVGAPTSAATETPLAGSAGGLNSGEPLASSGGQTSAPVGVPGEPSPGGATGEAPITASSPGTLGSQTQASVARPSNSGPSVASFYLILVVGAAVALAGAQLLRILAVRIAWTS